MLFLVNFIAETQNTLYVTPIEMVTCRHALLCFFLQ